MVKRSRSTGQKGSRSEDESMEATRVAVDALDRVFHEKTRLGIMTAVVGAADGLSFGELKRLCDLTDGNLSRHLNVLVEAKVLRVKKSGRGPRAQSVYRMTVRGQEAFDRYLAALETVLLAAKSNSEARLLGWE